MAENILAKQVGPLPIGAWVAVVGGGLVLAFYANRSQGGGGTQDDVLLAEPGVGEGGTQIIDTPPVFTGGAIETLDQWVNRAILYLIGQGKNPLAANNAVKKYATGQELNQDEQALVNLAIAGVGLPPAGELTEPSPTTPPPSPIPAGKYTITARIPATRRKGGSIRITGHVRKDGKTLAVGTAVTFFIKRAPAGSRPWVWRKTWYTNSKGDFDTRLSFPTGASYYVQVRSQGASTASQLVKTI